MWQRTNTRKTMLWVRTNINLHLHCSFATHTIICTVSNQNQLQRMPPIIKPKEVCSLIHILFLYKDNPLRSVFFLSFFSSGCLFPIHFSQQFIKFHRVYNDPSCLHLLVKVLLLPQLFEIDFVVVVVAFVTCSVVLLK